MTPDVDGVVHYSKAYEETSTWVRIAKYPNIEDNSTSVYFVVKELPPAMNMFILIIYIWMFSRETALGTRFGMLYEKNFLFGREGT